MTKPNQEILGPIGRGPSDSDDGVAMITFDSRGIEVRIMPDDGPFEVAANLAAEVVGQLQELDKNGNANHRRQPERRLQHRLERV